MKKLEEEFYNQKDAYSEEEEVSDQEDCYEKSDNRKQEDKHSEQVSDQEEDYEDCDESTCSEVYNRVTLDEVFKSIPDVLVSREMENNPLVVAIESSGTHEQSASSSKGRSRKLRKRVLSLKKGFSRLFRR